MGFQNRCRIASASGPMWLTVPLEGGRNQQARVGELYIAHRYHWQDRHWKALCSCYNRSPWFDHYRGSLEVVFQQSVERLMDWNLACWYWVQEQLGLKQEISVITGHDGPDSGVPITDRRFWLTPKTLAQEVHPIVRYPQVFESKLGFLPHLSVLDLLFCLGPQAPEYLRKNAGLTNSLGENS